MEHQDQSTRDERDERLVELEERIGQLEGRRGTVERSRTAASALVPAEARQHLRAAGREQLLAVRSLLDHWIGRLKDEPEKREKSRESIDVE